MFDAIFSRIFDNIDRKPEKNFLYKTKNIADTLRDQTYPIDEPTAMKNAETLTPILNNLLQDEVALEKAKAVQESRAAINQNREQFKKLLETEIIEKVRLSNYTDMKGVCTECSRFQVSSIEDFLKGS